MSENKPNRKLKIKLAGVEVKDESLPKPDTGLTDTSSSSLTRQLAEKVKEIEASAAQEISKLRSATMSEDSRRRGISAVREKRYMQVQALVDGFSVPSTKEDLLDMILYLKAQGYRSKCEECVTKAKALFPGDPIFQQCIKEFEAERKGDGLMVGAIYSALFWATAIFGIIAYKCDFGFWGWLGMISGGMVAGMAAGLVVYAILNSVLRKHPERFRTVLISMVSVAILTLAAPFAVDIIGNVIYKIRCETFYAFVQDENAADARKVLESMNFKKHPDEKYDLALHLIEVYINSDDVASAIDIYEIFTSDHCQVTDFDWPSLYCHGTNNNYELMAASLIMNSLIKAEDYDKAWLYHQKESVQESYYGNAQAHCEFLTTVALHLCASNRKSEAITFVKKNLAWFQINIDVLKDRADYTKSENYQNVYKQYNSYKVRTTLMQVISKYGN